MNKKHTANKRYLAIASVALVVILAGFFLVKAGGESARYYIENWTGNIVEQSEGPLGAIVYDEGRVTYDQLAEYVLQEKIVIISSASLDDLEDNEIELLPATSSNKVNQVVEIIAFNKFSSESFNRGGGSQESFEVKWGDITTASGFSGEIALGGSFSAGFLTAGQYNTAASKTTEVWTPYNPGDLTSPTTIQARIASSSAVYLTGLVNNSNMHAGGKIILHILYRILSIP